MSLNTAATEVNPRLTPDELGLYFVRFPGAVGQWDIYVATRAQVGDDFGAPMPVAGVNGAATDEFDPALTDDGLTMYLDSSKAGNGDVFVSTRTNVALDFSTPAPIAAVNTTDTERAVYVLPDGRALYFSRYGAMTGSGEKIYRAAITTTGVGIPVEVTGLEAVGSRGFPVLTPDELTIYFAMTGDGVPNKIWTATRVRANDPFGMPIPVTELNGAGSSENPGWISSNGCVLVFSSDRAGGSDLYVAQRSR